MATKLNKQELSDNLDEVKQVFIKQFNVNAEKYAFEVSSNGNFIVKRKGKSSNYVFFIYVDETKNYVFKAVEKGFDGIVENGFDNEIDEWYDDFVKIVEELSKKYWFYLKTPAFISNIATHRKAYVINIKTHLDKKFPFKIEYKQYKKIQEDRRKEWCLNKFRKEVENYIVLTVGAVTRKQLKAKIKEDVSRKEIINDDFAKFASFIKNYPHKNIVFGDDITSKINDIYKAITTPSYEYHFNVKNNCFEIGFGLYIYSFSPFDYTLVDKRNNNAFFNATLPFIQSINNNISYYEIISNFFKKIKSLNCNISDNYAKSFRDQYIEKDWLYKGIAYNDTALIIEHFDRLFPLYISIPHPKKDSDLNQIEKDTQTILNQLFKEVKTQVKTIDKQIIENIENDYHKIVFQSFAAQAIVDFLKTQPNKLSFSHIYDKLKSSSDNTNYSSDKNKEKYNGILKKYSKNELQMYLHHLNNLDILRSKQVIGIYNSFDAYYYNSSNKCYNFYFSNITRDYEDIIKALKNDKYISPKEAEKVLDILKAGEIKKEDVLYTLSIFKLHEFVLLNEDKIVEVFSKAHQSIKLYIPFIIDEYPSRSVERSVLNKIAKSK